VHSIIGKGTRILVRLPVPGLATPAAALADGPLDALPSSTA
jgi:hypothetical protein